MGEQKKPFGFGVVVLVGTVQVTSSQVGLEARTQPGLLTDALNVNCSEVPTVAPVGVMLILIPVTMVTVALALLVVSACAVAVIVTVGAMTVVPLDVVVGIVAGGV